MQAWFGRLLCGAGIVFVASLLLAALPTSAAAAEGWSADLLQQILRAEPTPASNAAAPAAATPVATAPAEMVLQTYHLAHLRVGEAGKPQNTLAILGKLLPSGSTVNADVGANSLHILTTAQAHKAAWDYLSAIDVPETITPAMAVVPDDVRAALQKLLEAGDGSARLAAAVNEVQGNVVAELAAAERRQRAYVLKLAAVLLAAMVVCVAAWVVLARHRGPVGERQAPTSLHLAPGDVAHALVPVHDKIRHDMLGLLNEVAIKLQAQHQEQQKLVREQHEQLETARLALVDERKQFIAETGSMVVQAVERVDATTAKLFRQQDKVAELVEELQSTVRELDHAKDQLRGREIDLEKERAKIAALSLLLEEGGALPPLEPEPAFTGNGCIPHLPSSTPCPTPNRIAPLPEPTLLATAPLENSPRFTFLPPHHPEN